MRCNVLSLRIHLVVLAVDDRGVTVVLHVRCLGGRAVVRHRVVFPDCPISRKRVSIR